MCVCICMKGLSVCYIFKYTEKNRLIFYNMKLVLFPKMHFITILLMISFLWWIVTDIMHAKQDFMCDLYFGLKMCFIVGVDG